MVILAFSSPLQWEVVGGKIQAELESSSLLDLALRSKKKSQSEEAVCLEFEQTLALPDFCSVKLQTGEGD